MKRPHSPAETYQVKTGDIRADFSREQLEGIGAVAMMYNEVEGQITSLFYEATGLPFHLQLEIFSRINGIDGIIAIIDKGAVDLPLTSSELIRLRDSLGKGGFKQLKAYRDAVVHARAYNAPMGIGIRLDRQASVFEVLLTKAALDSLYDRLAALNIELASALSLFRATREFNVLPADDPRATQLAASRSNLSVQFLEHQKKRLSLPQLPEFPSEQEMKAAHDNWYQANLRAQMAAIAQWFPEPTRRQGLSEAVRSTLGANVPIPPPEGEK